MSFKYIQTQQRKWERKFQLQEELEAKEEAERVAKLESEAHEREEIAYRKRQLLEQQENEHLLKQRMQKQKIMAEEKWDNQIDVLVGQIKDRFQKDAELEEIRFIVHNREPSQEVLDWTNWLLSDPLNQRLADLDFERAIEMFKRDNLMAKRRHGTRGKGKSFNMP